SSELYAARHLAVMNVQAGNNSFGQHINLLQFYTTGICLAMIARKFSATRAHLSASVSRWHLIQFSALITIQVANGADSSPYVIESKNFRIPAIGLSFNLPVEWTDLGKERIDTMNRLTAEQNPREKARYVAGLQRNLSFTRRSGYPTYMLIQR